MASSKDSEQLTTPQSIGAVMANALQEEMLGNTENMPQDAVSTTRGVIDDLILTNASNNSAETSVDDALLSEQSVVATATPVVQALDKFEKCLSSVCNQVHTSIETNMSEILTDGNDSTVPRPTTPIGQLQTQTSTMVDDNRQMQPNLRQHIMISYHHGSSFDICRRICSRLRDLGYNVWMDNNNLHGSIHEGMANAVDNSYIVLFCMNHQYFESKFCEKEVKYTDKKLKKFIPCLLEAKYKPEGWLGMIIGDQLYIDFSQPDKFDERFEELIAEIQDILARLHTVSVQTVILPSNNIISSTSTPSTPGANRFINDQMQNGHLRAVIRDFKESINQANHAAQQMTEEEFPQFVNYIRRRLFTNTLPIPQTNNNNSRELLEEILRHSQTQTELLRRITDILANITEPSTVIKFCMIFVFIWAINTFLKH